MLMCAPASIRSFMHDTCPSEDASSRGEAPRPNPFTWAAFTSAVASSSAMTHSTCPSRAAQERAPTLLMSSAACQLLD
eukprot:scaffold105891_cov37-Tisochrysis_lutea.AAC.2